MTDGNVIDQAIATHGKWKLRLQMAIATGQADAPAETIARDDQCAFGAWLYGPGLSAIEKASIHYETVKALHAEFHSAAALVLQYATDGKKQPAQQMLETYAEFTAISSKLARALTEWKLASG